MTQLFWSLFDTDTTSPTCRETRDDARGMGIRWSLDGHGVIRIEAEIKARNKWDLWDRLQHHASKRMALYTNWYRRPVSGYITEVHPVGANAVGYVAAGPGVVRLEDAYDTTLYPSTDNVTKTLSTILTDHVPVVTNSDNIDTNATTLGGWQPKLPEGETPKDMIRVLLDMSDSSYGVYHFWLRDRHFQGMNLRGWEAFYRKQGSTAFLTWLATDDDIAGKDAARMIDPITSVKIYYGVISGTHTGANNSTATLTDSGASFVANGVKEGDRVYNITDGSSGRVKSVDSATQLTIHPLTGGTDNDFDTNDIYSVSLQDSQLSVTATGTAVSWGRQIVEQKPRLSSTQATQYANALLQEGTFASFSLTLGSPLISTIKGARWPLFEVIANGGAYIELQSEDPALAVFTATTGDDRRRLFITAMDYAHDTRKLRLAVDTPDRRIDAALRLAGILRQEMIVR